MKVERKVVITGIGILSPIAIGRDAFWNALIQGDTGFRSISLFDTSPYPVSVAGEITDFDPVLLLGKKGLRTLDRSTRLICSAATLAIDDAHLQITENNTYTTGVAIGTTFGSLHSISQFDRSGLIDGPKLVNPSLFPNTVINSPASQVSIRFKIKGFNTTLSTGLCASLDAVSYASDFIRLNRAHVVLAGGVEELCEETFHGFYKLGCLSGMDGLNPICCPFDARRNGIIISEGAAVLVLEEEDHALLRSADILAKISGYGNAFDPEAKKDFSHQGKGLRKAILLALEDAALTLGEIDYISSSANSTKELDRMETNVIKEIFGEYVFKMPVSSIKSMVGESFSASGSLAMTAAVGALHKGFIPPTVNYKEKDPLCDLDYVANEARQKNVKNVLIISSDPYGNNAAIVFSKYRN
jgi:3-oxoacyl-[acyl-carrier-protein] synthase II